MGGWEGMEEGGEGGGYVGIGWELEKERAKKYLRCISRFYKEGRN